MFVNLNRMGASKFGADNIPWSNYEKIYLILWRSTQNVQVKKESLFQADVYGPWLV